jgi:hypothetical protein
MIFQPKIVYNGITVILSLSQKLWTYEEGPGMGGEDVSAAGVPESYVVRWDNIINVTLRFLESERDAVMEWIKWAMSNKGSVSVFYFDSTDPDVASYAVYMEKPKAGDRIAMPREQGSPWIMSTEVKLRTVSASRPARNPYPG